MTRWKREAGSQGNSAFAGTETPRDEELARLKRELARVKNERDFFGACFGAGAATADRLRKNLISQNRGRSQATVFRALDVQGSRRE